MKLNHLSPIHILSALVLLAVVSRILFLGSYPSMLNRDEASLAINARFITEEGRDEWGNSWPHEFKAFGEYKLPGYIYLLSALFVFAENDVVVRLPAAVAGIAIVFLMAEFAKQLLSAEQFAWHRYISVAFVMLTTPFAFFYSRMGWEATLALAFFLGMSVLSFRKAKNQSLNDAIAVLLGLLSLLTYSAEFILVPAMIPVIIGKRWTYGWKSWLPLVLLLSVVWLIVAITYFRTSDHKSGLLIFENPDIIAQYPEYRFLFPTHLQPMLGNIPAFYIYQSGYRFIETLSWKFSVTQGGQHPWHSIFGQGHLYWSVYVLFWVGLIEKSSLIIHKLMYKRFKSSELFISLFSIYLLIVSTLPSILTTDSPHATRNLFGFCMMVIFSVEGFFVIYKYLSKKRILLTRGVIGSIVLVFLLESIYYGYQYVVLWPPVYSPDLKVGLEHTLDLVKSSHPNTSIQVADDSGFLYVIPVWYQDIPYNTFMKSVERQQPDERTGLYRTIAVDQYTFIDENFHEAVPGLPIVFWDGKLLQWEVK